MSACTIIVKKIRNLLNRRLSREFLEDLDHAVDQLHGAFSFLMFLFLRGGQFGGLALFEFSIGRGRCFGRPAASGAEQSIAFEGTDRDLAGLAVQPPDPVLADFQEFERGFRSRALCLHMARDRHGQTGDQHGCK